MKKIWLASLVAGVFALSFGVQAAGENTISLGYAQSHVKADGETLKENPKGFNIKYRNEIDGEWSVLGSFVYTHQGYDYYYGSRKVGNGDLDYYSLTVGPGYRFNEYVSAYALVGAAHGKVKSHESYSYHSSYYSGYYSSDYSESKTALAYGAGLQFNPIPNLAIDASYEYSKLSDVKVGTWMVGVGYRF